LRSLSPEFELPWFSDWEVAEITKWGMPGAYAHSFMDGWSPGYLGSVAYNHNGLMKMYETQSGRDTASGSASESGRGGAAGTRGGPPPGGTGRGVAASGEARSGGAGRSTVLQVAIAPVIQGAAGRGGSLPTGRGGTQEREWYRGIPVPQNAAATFSRRDNTNYMETGVLLSLQLTSMFPGIIVENFYVKTRNSIEEGKTMAPYGFVIPVGQDAPRGKVTGAGAAGLAVAHYGSNNMITFRYRLRNVPLKIAERSFTAEGVEFPAGSFVIAGAMTPEMQAAIVQTGLIAAALSAMPAVPMHDADVPRIAIYSQWSSTQDLGWYRLTFDKFGVPYDLIFKEQVKQGALHAKYDVILMAAQNISRSSAIRQGCAQKPHADARFQCIM
jgi:hypothetical protein